MKAPTSRSEGLANYAQLPSEDQDIIDALVVALVGRQLTVGQVEALDEGLRHHDLTPTQWRVQALALLEECGQGVEC